MTVVRQHHRLNGHALKQTSGDSGGQRSLACCSPWGHKELDTTEGLNNTSQGHRIISSGQEKYWTHYVGLLLLPGSASSQRNKQELSKGPL